MAIFRSAAQFLGESESHPQDDKELSVKAEIQDRVTVTTEDDRVGGACILSCGRSELDFMLRTKPAINQLNPGNVAYGAIFELLTKTEPVLNLQSSRWQ